MDLTFIPNRTGDIGQFQLGGWQTTREAASGLVSEVLIYDRVLSYGEIDALQYYLNNKYGLQDDAPVRGPVDTSSEGDFEIRYAVVDSSGNRVTQTRTVQVIPAPGSPTINMLGDPVVQHEAGIPYQDEGAALIDGDGNTLDPSLIEVFGTPSGNESGDYIITYNFQDSQGRPAVEGFGLSRLLILHRLLLHCSVMLSLKSKKTHLLRILVLLLLISLMVIHSS